MSLQVIKTGLLDTIQDAGRFGHQHLGINPTGAMDRYALNIANILVGNQPDEAAIEIHFPASVYLFAHTALIALTGADLSASINGDPVPINHPILVIKNDVLQFHKPIHGARCYLAIAGGFAIEPWMNSTSTHLRAKAGGHNGRQLVKGDSLFSRETFTVKHDEFIVLPWKADTHWVDETKEILALPGNEWNRLSTESKENFTMTSFVITQQSDRMGYRLNNIPLPVMTNEELVSSAVGFGTVQLLPDGKLIILMADHQTTGGYPRIAHLVSAHHSRLAQMKAGDKLQFGMTDHATAEALYMKQQQHLQQLQNACRFRLEEYFHAY